MRERNPNIELLNVDCMEYMKDISLPDDMALQLQSIHSHLHGRPIDMHILQRYLGLASGEPQCITTIRQLYRLRSCLG